MALKQKIKLSNLKYKALELRAKRQLPYQLVQYINDLTDKSDVNYVQLLMNLTEHYLRVPRYYAKYKDAEYQANEDIKRLVTNFNK